MPLTGLVVDVAALSESDRSQMLALMERHYSDVSSTDFHADLHEKQWVILLRDEEGNVKGFSTQMVLEATIDGRPIRALFSGDTIVDRQHWGDTSLMKLGLDLGLSLKEQNAGQELYWFLISKGYKTYRFLPLLFKDFYPHYDRPIPSDIRQVIDTFASDKFGPAYDPLTNIFRSQTYRLREGLAEPSLRSHDPHVRFFVERNPGHAQGDELCCIAPISSANFTTAALRLIK